MRYEPTTKIYVCKACGRVYELEELKTTKERFLKSVMESDEEKRKKRRREIVKWWLGEKSVEE